MYINLIGIVLIKYFEEHNFCNAEEWLMMIMIENINRFCYYFQKKYSKVVIWVIVPYITWCKLRIFNK